MPRIARLVHSASIVALSMLALASCSALQQRTVTVSESELQKRISEQFVLPISVLQIFNISLTNPVIKLDGGKERLYAQMDTGMDNPITGQKLAGKLNISGKLRFDAAYNAIMLSDARVEDIHIDGIDSRYNNVLNALASKIGAEMLDNTPLYTLKAEDLQSGSRHYIPKEFKVVGNTLQVTLVPK